MMNGLVCALSSFFFDSLSRRCSSDGILPFREDAGIDMVQEGLRGFSNKSDSM